MTSGPSCQGVTSVAWALLWSRRQEPILIHLGADGAGEAVEAVVVGGGWMVGAVVGGVVEDGWNYGWIRWLGGWMVVEPLVVVSQHGEHGL